MLNYFALGGTMSFNINNRRYTGSKYKIRNWIRKIIKDECENSNSFCDLFAGTGIITYTMINDYDKFIINDLLFSNQIIYNAFFGKEDYDEEKIIKTSLRYKNIKLQDIVNNYVSINFGDKFFTMNDAKLIGYIRDDIEINKKNLNKREYDILLASLLYSLDKCANTVGHYESYCKKNNIKSNFRYELVNPVIKSSHDTREICIYREDANILARKIECDVVYIDPPYSSRQYSRFYHVLETIVKWDKPTLYGTALKPIPENMSEYCRSKALDFFKELVFELKCKYIVVSYNNTYNSKSKSSENKMKLDDMLETLSRIGKTEIYSIDHQVFNAGKTNITDHKEILFITKVGALNE